MSLLRLLQASDICPKSTETEAANKEIKEASNRTSKKETIFVIANNKVRFAIKSQSHNIRDFGEYLAFYKQFMPLTKPAVL